jgi:hypothetical protein
MILLQCVIVNTQPHIYIPSKRLIVYLICLPQLVDDPFFRKLDPIFIPQGILCGQTTTTTTQGWEFYFKC